MYEYNCRGGDVVQHCIMSSAAAQQALAQTVSQPNDMHSTVCMLLVVIEGAALECLCELCDSLVLQQASTQLRYKSLHVVHTSALCASERC
jgi:hypothetical protein